MQFGLIKPPPSWMGAAFSILDVRCGIGIAGTQLRQYMVV
jgi:hypothetical protein